MSDIYINMVDDNIAGKNLCFIPNLKGIPMVAYMGVLLDLLGVILRIKKAIYSTEKDVGTPDFWMDAIKEVYSDKSNHLGEFNEEQALKVYKEIRL